MGRALPLLSCDAPSPSSPATTPGTVVREERKDAARNRKKILDAAREVMQRRGLDSVCMDELAAAAGVGKGTLYRRFHDKFALFRALLDDDERVLQEAVRRRFELPKTAPPQQRLMTLWNALVDFVVDRGLPGIDRVVPVGKALDMDVIWDGYMLVEQLSRIVHRA